jgi:hypothetical protein
MIDRATGKGILIGLLVSGLFYVFVRPALDYLPSVFLRMSGALSQRLVDRVYSDAAQSATTVEVLVVPTLALVLALLLGELLDRSFPDRPERAKPKALKALSACVVVLGFFGVVALFVTGTAALTSRAMERCFHSQLAVLSPHLSDLEAKELVAMWTLMRNHSDFETVNRQIAEHARKYNVAPVLRSLEGNPKGRCL